MQITITSQPYALLDHNDVVVRQSLALDGTDRDDQADQLLLAAQAELDGPKGKLGFSVAEQSVLVTADSFDDPLIRLPGGQIIGAVVVTYIDGDGDTQTLDDETYVVAADGTVTLIDGGSWPTIAEQEGAVSVAYTVGIDDDDDPRVAQMKSAIIMHAKLHMDMDDPDVRRKVIENMTSTLWVPVL